MCLISGDVGRYRDEVAEHALLVHRERAWDRWVEMVTQVFTVQRQCQQGRSEKGNGEREGMKEGEGRSTRE